MEPLVNPQTRPGYEFINSWAAGPEPRVNWDNRLSIISWLMWNDHNGCYTDEDVIFEGLEPLTLEQAREHMIEQVRQA